MIWVTIWFMTLTFILAINDDLEPAPDQDPNANIQPGQSLLKVDHYENRVTSLSVMLAHEAPYKPLPSSPDPSDAPKVSVRHDVPVTDLQTPSGSVPVKTKPLLDTILDNTNSDTDEIETDMTEITELPDLTDNFDFDMESE